MAWIRDINSLYNFIGYVVLCAPNSFPKEDFMAPDQQMNLDLAFNELRTGMGFIEAGAANAEQRRTLASLLDQSLEAYRAREDVKGAHLLQDFQNLIFKTPA